MNKDQVHGKIDEVVGTVKRKSGELTGNKQLEVKGTIQQVKGKLENVVGKAKDIVHDANKDNHAHSKNTPNPAAPDAEHTKYD